MGHGLAKQLSRRVTWPQGNLAARSRQLFPVILALALLVPQLTSASAASYQWGDSAGSFVTASGGPFGQGLKLTQSSSADPVTFTAGTTLDCSGHPTPVTVELDVAKSDYQHTYPTPAQAFVTPANGAQCQSSGVESQVKISQASANNSSGSTTDPAAAPGNQPPPQCDQGGFSWVTCPIMENISTAVTGVAEKVLTPLLEVRPLSQQNTPGLYQAWNNVKHFTEVLFAFIFMLAIFSSAMQFGLDQYTVKRILPRLVAAAVLIQFSFFISAVLVDMGNVFGAGISNLILANFNTGASHNAGVNAVANVGSIAAALAVGGYALYANWIMALPMLVLMLIGVLAILFTLAARYMIIALLVAAGPLAVLAWVLPNTEHYFKKWLTLLTRLIMMYPLIIGILAVVSRLTEILGFTDGATANGFTNFLTDLLKPVLLIVALMIVPFAFKWAGGIMHTVHAHISGLRSKSQGMLKDSDWYKERKTDAQAKNLERMKRFNDKVGSMKYLGGAKGKAAVPGRAVAGMSRGLYGAMLAGAPSTERAIEKKHSQYVGTYHKELGDLEVGQDVNALINAVNASYGDPGERERAQRWLELNAPTLMRYTETESGRMAVLKLLADKGPVGFKTMDKIARNMPAELSDAKRAVGKAYKGSPMAFAFRSEGEVEIRKDGSRVVHKAGDVNVESVKVAAGGWDAQAIKGDLKPDNWEAARLNEQISEGMADATKYTVYDDVLSSNSRVRAQAPKRLEMFKWIASRHDELRAQGGNAAEIVRVAKERLDDNRDIWQDLAGFARKGEPDKGIDPFIPDWSTYWPDDPGSWTDEQRERYVRAWLKIR